MVGKQDGDCLGKGINDYLNHYVLIADGKAAALAAGSLVLLGLSLGADVKNVEPVLRLIGTTLAGLAAVLAGLVFYPRTPHSGSGHIFWADIRAFPSAESYWESLIKLDDEAIGREYANQNYFVSSVLLKKNAMVRRTIWMLGLACVTLAVGFGVR
jgi:Family of unknown function (DUF5706)